MNPRCFFFAVGLLARRGEAVVHGVWWGYVPTKDDAEAEALAKLELKHPSSLGWVNQAVAMAIPDEAIRAHVLWGPA